MLIISVLIVKNMVVFAESTLWTYDLVKPWKFRLKIRQLEMLKWINGFLSCVCLFAGGGVVSLVNPWYSFDYAVDGFVCGDESVDAFCVVDEAEVVETFSVKFV